MTLADEDTNSILTDNANRAFQGNVAMQVTQPGGQWKDYLKVVWKTSHKIIVSCFSRILYILTIPIINEICTSWMTGWSSRICSSSLLVRIIPN